MKNRITTTIMTAVMILFCSSTIVVAQSDNVVPSGFPELDEWVSKCKVERPNALGYPGNYDSKLDGFYTWYTENKMMNILINNAGDPFELLKTVGIEGWKQQATAIMENTAYLVQELTRIGWPCWNNKYSNTVFFKRPVSEIVTKYNLANSYDERFGGDLSDVVVMQHVKKEVIDKFIAELESTMTAISATEANTENKKSEEYSLAGTRVTNGDNPSVVVSKGRKRLSGRR